jgi:hypothetical protein
MDSNFLKYLSTAPVLLTVWLSLTAGLVSESFYSRHALFPNVII